MASRQRMVPPLPHAAARSAPALRACCLRVALLLVSLRAAAAEASRVQFAIYENALYARVDGSIEDRAYTTLMHLLTLVTKYPAVLEHAPPPADATATVTFTHASAAAAHEPHGAHAAALRLARVPLAVHGTIGGCMSDWWDSPPPAQLPNGSVAFSFWRPSGVGNNVTRLLPDHDVAGWAVAWTPPMSLVARELAAASAPPFGWSSRVPFAMWTGAVSGDWRRSFVACAAKAPGMLVADIVSWGQMREQHSTPGEPLLSAPGEPPGGRGTLKPLAADLRKLTRYKFLVYLPGNTWSSSLKRMALAGGLLFMPRENPHESLASQLLTHACGEDILWYDGPDPEAMCASMQPQVEALQADDADAELRAARFAACARNVLSDHRLDAATLLTLHEAAEAQQGAGAPPFPLEMLDRDANASFSLARGKLTRIDGCADMKRRWAAQVGETYGWQVDAWYDNDCGVRAGNYLRYTAL